MYHYLTCFFIGLIPVSVSAQRFVYKAVPQKYHIYYDNALKGRDSIRQLYFSNATDAIAYLPKNFSKNGDVDYTPYLQHALDINERVIMPDFPILISPDGLKPRSDSKILFQKNSKLVIQPNAQEEYHALWINDVSNVQIYFADIVGDKDRHLGNKGQWGIGIWINNSKDVKIYAPRISKCWGDGIDIRSLKGHISDSIIIENGFIDNNRRNGISIAAGRNIIIRKTSVGNSIGHNPQSGIDIEPNSNYDVLQNIRMEHIITYHNPWNGIIISIGSMAGPKQKNISIFIDNHEDFGSFIGLAVNLSRSQPKNYLGLSGTINISNSYYENNKIFIRNYTRYKTNVKIDISNHNLIRDSLRESYHGDIDKFINSYEDKYRDIE